MVASTKKPANNAGFLICLVAASLSGFVLGQLGILRNQCDQGVLLAVGELAEPLKQFALVKTQLRAIESHVQIIIKRALLQEALLESCNDLRVHASVVVA